MYSREGLTVDVVARFLRRTTLNPWLTVPLSAFLAWGQVNHHGTPTLASNSGFHRAFCVTVWSCALAGVVLSVNDGLNKWSANNWTATDPQDWKWNKEIAVITGASGGIGASIAQELLARNPKTKIVVVDYSPMTWKPPTGTIVLYYQCDLSDSSAVRALCSRIRSDVGHPTVLVNNAGLCRGLTVMEGTYHDVELTVRTNLIAPFLLVKEVLPNMVKTNHGHIMNVSSMSSLIPPARVADYAATKAGISAMHETLQLELKHVHNAPNVRLSLGIFSFIKTPLFKGETRQSGFLFPLLDVDSVGEALVDVLHSGYGKTIYMPGIMRYVAMLRGSPEWVMRAVREGTQSLGVDFKGRQKVDEKTGRLR